MNDKTLELLTRVAEQLGTTVDRVLGLAAHRVVVESLIGILFEVGVFVGIFFLVKWWRNNKTSDATLNEMISLSGGLILIIVISLFVVYLYSDIVSLCTIEYEAIEKVIQMITF